MTGSPSTTHWLLPSLSNHAPKIVCGMCWLLIAVAPTEAHEVGELGVTINTPIGKVLSEACLDCHSDNDAEAGVALDKLNTLQLDERLDVLNRAQAQVFFDLMPPADETGISAGNKKVLSDWLSKELGKHSASQLEQKLQEPAYGNFVSHELLFSGEIGEKPFTRPRRWLVSPQIFIQRVNDVFMLEGRNRKLSFYGVTNPIILPDHSGVRYYDTASLDGGHLLIMLNNAKWIAEKQLLAAQLDGQNRKEHVPANPKDRWLPPTAQREFVAIVQSKETPTSEQMRAAIEAQFKCVMQRPPTDAERTQYEKLLTNAIKKAGNVAGLKQTLISILLNSEFMYRTEFGEGEVDQWGRRILSPREASYAIAYALTDRGPDKFLKEAASSGRLHTKADFRREVSRILEDDENFIGEVSPTVSSGYIRPHKSTHPKLIRFFREFFGYPASLKLFKDEARSGGFYDNAGRDYTGTAGSVTNEADRVVDRIVASDKDVFERLLTTEEFFVLHPKSNEEGKKLVADWFKAYKTLRDLDWQADTRQFLVDNHDRYKEHFKTLRITDMREERLHVQVRNFKRFMEFFDNTFGKSITPITFPWFFHGGQKFRHSEIYSLPKLAGAGPLTARGTYDDEPTWDYPLEQPFVVPHRKGILTHPAWLLAHSQNTETDPVRRGRWIREKLLAGSVPDVPITVDAQIPEDPHHTLRERLESVTRKQECWKCHRQMNPLGLAFEAFDDFGRYRTEESLEHPENLLKKGDGKTGANIYKTKPVVAAGMLSGTGDASLDGPVEDAFDLIDRLAKSDRARQSIIRHAFRFFLGRNEMLSDAQTLIDADQAYVKSGGSFKQVVISILSSDSFVYRKAGPIAPSNL